MSIVRRLWNRLSKSPLGDRLSFDRPLVLFQSDDWGRVGVRDRDGYEDLCVSGLSLGEQPYDFYSLETAEDLNALREVLGGHRDSTGRSASMVMNFIMANVDFERSLAPSQKEILLHPLSEGLPGTWRRPELLNGYRDGVRDRVFFPALHGLTHFCTRSITRELTGVGERAELLRKLWRAETPYIYWRMPWIGYEYWDPAPPATERFLSIGDQRSLIKSAADIFRAVFDSIPFSACAPGYRANKDTWAAWRENGVRVAQNGPGDRSPGDHGPGDQQRPFLNEDGMLFTFRTLEIEPAAGSCDVASLVRKTEECFKKGIPAVISIHSINFHSTIRDFRTPTLKILNEFMSGLEKKWPDLLYIHDADLYALATEGSYVGVNGNVRVGVTTVGAGA